MTLLLIISALVLGVSVGWILGKSSHERTLEQAYTQGRENERVLLYVQWRDGKGRFAKKPTEEKQ